MSYQVLARKWRPQTFGDLVGQPNITRALINALTQQRLHHAYLLTGTRGVGKTTLARILAKCFNCESGITATPCRTCANCTAIEAGHHPDLFEIDAASRTKVEDTRELLNNIPYAPTQARYKIYIIDEVHMLSSHSFNALLKTLEEPPAHVKFLLATTDPEKLPITVLSRCLQLHLKNLPADLIAEHLANVLTQEGIAYEPAALMPLALAAKGSVRDSLSLLDQAIAYCDNQLTQIAINQMLGHLPTEQLQQLVQHLLTQNMAAGLECIAEMQALGADFNTVIEDLLTLWHQLAITKAIPEQATPALVNVSQQLSAEELQLYYQITLIGKRDLPLAPDPKLGFEMLFLRLAQFSPVTAVLPLAPIAVSPTIVKEPVINPVKSPISTAAPTISTATPPISATVPAATNTDDWHALVNQLALSGMTKQFAEHLELIAYDQSKQQFSFKIAKLHTAFMNEQQKQRLTQALNTQLQATVTLNITVNDTPLTSTPAAKKAQENQANHEALKQTMQKDPKLTELADLFSAKIDFDAVSSTSSNNN